MDFLIDLFRVANRAANLLAQEAGISLAQPVNECLNRSHTNLQRVSRLLARK